MPGYAFLLLTAKLQNVRATITPVTPQINDCRSKVPNVSAPNGLNKKMNTRLGEKPKNEYTYGEVILAFKSARCIGIPQRSNEQNATKTATMLLEKAIYPLEATDEPPIKKTTNTNKKAANIANIAPMSIRFMFLIMHNVLLSGAGRCLSGNGAPPHRVRSNKKLEAIFSRVFTLAFWLR